MFVISASSIPAREPPQRALIPFIAPALSVTCTPALRISAIARSTSPDLSSTPRHPSRIKCVRRPSPTASNAVNLTDGHGAEARAQRRALEAFHGRIDPEAVDTAWPFLKSADRYLRYAARVAIEHQPVATWADRAFAEADPRTAIAALTALARCSDEAAHFPRIIGRLTAIAWEPLADACRGDLLRALQTRSQRQRQPPARTFPAR